MYFLSSISVGLHIVVLMKPIGNLRYKRYLSEFVFRHRIELKDNQHLDHLQHYCLFVRTVFYCIIFFSPAGAQECICHLQDSNIVGVCDTRD